MHDVIQFTPNFLTYGRELHMPIDIVYGTAATKKYDSPDDFVNDLHKRTEEAYTSVRVHSGIATKEQILSLVEAPKIRGRGSGLVLLTRRRQSRYYKWASLYTGPYSIVAKIGPVNFRIRPVPG